MTPSARRRLLLVHAHPDDETLTTGGTMARHAADPDTSVTLVTCTLGEEGEIIPPELALLAPDAADQLGGYRIGELSAACAALGVTDHRFLGGAGRWRDSGMVLAGQGVRAASPSRLHPRALAAPDAFADQVDALTAVLEEVAPRRVPEVARIYATVIGRTTLDAGLAVLAGAVVLPFRMPLPDELPSVPDADVDVTLDVTAHRAARLAALRAHATQVALWEAPSGNPAATNSTTAFAMSNGVAQPLLDVEEFTLLAGEPADGADDLFAGVA